MTDENIKKLLPGKVVKSIDIGEYSVYINFEDGSELTFMSRNGEYGAYVDVDLVE